jgi:hypothetical protein
VVGVARTDPNQLPERETGPIGSLPIYRPFVSDRRRNTQVIGVATVNGTLCLVQASYTPIAALLEEMQALLVVSTC